jgi:uracil-DNA glycosylase
MASQLERLSTRIRACRICVEKPDGDPLPHEPRPVFRVSETARLAIVSQAPGTRVHASGVPFSDASGERLRAWMGVTPDEFYDMARVAIIPMGFCFPGHNAKGGDLPPRRECARQWHGLLFAQLARVELVLIPGQYGQRWHLGADAHVSLTETVRDWRRIAARRGSPVYIPLPHPSWRNNGWLRANPWFEDDLLPFLRDRVREILTRAPGSKSSGRPRRESSSRATAGVGRNR